MENNLVFVSAQPDVPYFHWQIKVYVHNFIQKGINPNDIHVVLAIVQGKKEPSKESLELKDLGINIHHYVDNRDKKHYIPNIKPFLIYKWLEENPQYGKSFFLHDADIIFRELPDFKELMKDNIIYLSDTVGYIGYDYIMDCCDRYETQYPNSNKGQLIQEMTDVVGVNINCVKCNQENSGGGQYIIKDTDSEMWKKIYDDCVPLYDQMMSYQKRFPISPGEIQFWTAEMWSVLWNLWYFGKETKVTKELDFSWATDDLILYNNKPILHMAGVTEDLKDRKFYKGEYINDDPLLKIENDPNYFDFIEKNSSTIKYIEVMKSLIQQKRNN
jgi:hypothetical protein